MIIDEAHYPGPQEDEVNERGMINNRKSRREGVLQSMIDPPLFNKLISDQLDKQQPGSVVPYHTTERQHRSSDLLHPGDPVKIEIRDDGMGRLKNGADKPVTPWMSERNLFSMPETNRIMDRIKRDNENAIMRGLRTDLRDML